MLYRPIVLTLFASFFIISSCKSQDVLSNLNLENVDQNSENFPGIIKWGSGYYIGPDTSQKHSGKYSLRIEPADNADKNFFGCGVFRIPADKQGSIIELRGYLKLENVSGSAGLFMRIDNTSGQSKMDNMLNRGINGTADWKEYSIKLSLGEDDQSIYFGAILSGNGKLWADDFQILIDGKQISETQAKVLTKYKAHEDKEFDNGSGINLSNLNKNDFQNLVLLGKIWGFLKYYHPAVSNGDYNWDYELFRILPKLINQKNKEQRNEVLSKWIESFGEIKEKQDYISPANATIKFSADLKWTANESELGKKLCEQLHSIISAKRDQKNFYIDFMQGVGNPIFKNENPYAQMSYPDTGFRLLALYRYWNIIQYFFPYKNLIKEDWNQELQNFIPEFIQAKDAIEYRLILLKLIGKIDDTHANIWSNDTILNNYKGTRSVPVEVTFIQNKPVITNIYREVDSTLPFKAGDVIEKINNKNVSEIISGKLAYYPASNYPTKLRNIARELLWTNEEYISVTFSRNEEQRTEKIKSVQLEKLFKSKQDDKAAFKRMGDIAYFYPGKIKNGSLNDIIKKIDSCKGLVIDMRCYPSEFIVFSFGQYLMSQPTEFVKFTGTDLKMPGTFNFRPALSVGYSNTKNYKGKVVIIVNETTQSSAEYTTMAFRKAPGAIVIGSTTSGADGNVSSFTLPGGINTMISGIGVYYPDGTETQGIGIVADIEVKPTIKGIMEGRDEPLEKAIEIINSSL